MEEHTFRTFLWRVVSIHTIVYFIAGILALVFMNYKELFAGEMLSVFMRPVDSPWVAAGPALQVFRGILLACILYPFRKVFLEASYGWLTLWLLVLGLSFVSTIGPTVGSFEGFIYTKFPIPYHLLAIPEAVVYSFGFSYLLCAWYRRPRRLWAVLSIVLVAFILLMSVMGVLSSLGILNAA
ncbi:hypothetical protein [Spirochaeta thermophila]|uniref:Uncharacterized protein n=1 Tax=Winmispira thermophila (strain ATCC 49972 / DSM 6192 / RI 19.B1) TaxID=665571 RepID=E0RN20_WINT6|nr:hypothetical protein [Spirochaeta thermophila]ADN02489.1 hypothetical protein STHERM_c15490 [Spirochaeta thermophila DSM 6192]